MKDYFKLVASICSQNLLERFAGSYLGAIWMFIWPLVQLFIYIIIFGKLMGSRLGAGNQIYSYGIYVASGLLCWTMFSNTLMRVSRVLVEKKPIISKVAVDLRVFPAAICLEEIFPFILGLFILTIVDLFSGWHPDITLTLLTLFAIYCLLVLSFGLGLFFSCCAVFIRDIMELVPLLLQIVFWFTPIVYLPSILPDFLQNLLWINPMTGLVHVLQQYFVFGNNINWFQVIYFILFSHVSFLLGLYIHHRMEKDIRDVL